MASNEQQKVAKRNSLGHCSHRRPSLLSAMKVYKDADEQKGNKSESNSRKSSMTPEIKVETSINDQLDSSSTRPLLLLHPTVMSTSTGGIGGSGGSSVSKDGGSRVRSSSFSRQSHEPLLKPVPESSSSYSSSPPSSSTGSRSTLKTPPSYASQRPAARRNSFCVSREVKQKHSSLKTLGIFK